MAPQRSIESISGLRVLANGVRQEIFDTIEALGGEASVREIAEQLGRPMDGLYYHLRQLVAAELLVELDDDLAAGRRYRIRTPAGQGRVKLRYAPATGERQQALRQVVRGMLKISADDFASGLADPNTVLEGEERELWAARGKGWLNRTELRRANQLLQELSDLLRPGRREADDRLYAISFLLAPQPVRDSRR